MSAVKNHEAANIFPMMSGYEYESLKTSIYENGQREPITLFDELILDGRNRYKACIDLGIKPTFITINTDDPLQFVLDLNLHRRHLNESQRALVAASIANMPDHRPTNKGANLHPLSAAEAAEKLNVSERSVKTAKQIKEKGSPELVAAVESGKVAVSDAVVVVDLTTDQQDELLAKVTTGESKNLKAAKQKSGIGKKEAPPLPEGKYNVLVIDPPWPMEKIERDARPNQIGFDYPTMTEDELARLDLPFGDDSHIFLWTTHKFLPMALRLFICWDVKYILTMVWHKPGGFQPFNLPQYNCEFVLYGRIGTPKFADTKAFNVCFNAARGKHSEKPEEFYELLRRVTDGKRIDIFNRRPIDGFDAWGNEA
jgi:N6-adenosine-specific RNA methylase IME4/ParB-like chromosome segregation protein Spo0J